KDIIGCTVFPDAAGQQSFLTALKSALQQTIPVMIWARDEQAAAELLQNLNLFHRLTTELASLTYSIRCGNDYTAGILPEHLSLLVEDMDYPPPPRFIYQSPTGAS
ncbi:MAG: hypothetical protein KDA79_25255, partial [Planctomycetaceae bacterium]|nr:hypothetical protein [Planctomycetaceae bacterium]